jgi:predicted NodU family carbamoyl transferase
MKKHIYVLGTGTSHNGSTCLLKDGKVCVAIEKERVTKIKHDGFNDSETIRYCLQAEGITIDDIDLIVQNANFGMFKYGSDYYRGQRLISEKAGIPIVTISHHLAHAYSAIGTCPFDDFNVLVMDGCGNPFDECMDLENAYVPDREKILLHPELYVEKDSYYHFNNNQCTSVVKEFSEFGYLFRDYPMHPRISKHSIGGLYEAVSVYCFGSVEDPGKLMGLGPYGRPGKFNEEIFDCRDGRIYVNYDWMAKYRNPARSYDDFKKGFQYYADIAYGVQREVEKAILYIVQSRLEVCPAENLCYSGGTALNAVANTKILEHCDIKNIYMEPAAGDNGLAIGCAYYGWLEVLKKERVKHNGSTCFGKTYTTERIKEDINTFVYAYDPVQMRTAFDLFFELIDNGQHHIPGAYANIQFNIENFGVFQVAINEKVACGNKIFGSPTCIVHTKANDFYGTLVTANSFESLVRSGKMKATNFKDLEILMAHVDMDNVLARVKQKMNGHALEKLPFVKHTWSDDYIRKTAELLAAGNVIGWFQDGCEFGPRALGRRSILADPRKPEVRNFINSQIKFREDFRPFAPSVLLEDVATYFKHPRESPYMILVDDVLDEYKEQIRGVVHVNNTSRIQTVTPGWNPKYHALLQEFKKLTGMSVLLNTSFNRKGMPIVETPKDALNFFFSCKLDHLVIDSCIISK